MIYTILIMLSSLTASYAGDCTWGEPLDLRSTHRKIFDKIGILDQERDGLCYGFAATTLLDFYRFKSRAYGEHRISPLEASVYSKVQSGVHEFSGGHICEVVNALVQRGYACDSGTVNRDEMFHELGVLAHREIVTKVYYPYILRVEKFQEVTPLEFKTRVGLTSDKKRFLDRFDFFYELLVHSLVNERIPREQIPSKKKIFFMSQEIHKRNRYDALAKEFGQLLLEKACADSTTRIPKLRCVEDKSGSGRDLIGKLHQHLGLKEPVGITYCSSVLRDRKARGIKNGNLLTSCGLHASVVIGKKMNEYNGKCSYLIRNSWGEQAKYDWETSKGDVWVDEDALMANLAGVTVLSP